jgi:hypothetical protein
LSLRLLGARALALTLAASVFLPSPLVFAWEQEPAQTQGATEPATAFGADDIAVYTRVFESLFQAGKRLPIVLADHTAIGVPPGMLVLSPLQDPKSGQFLAKLSREARQDYQLKNKHPVALPSPCPFAPECTIMDIVRLTGMVMNKDKNDKGWDRFFERYPNAPGIFVVSRIGFNPDHSEAILYVGKSCGTLCGDGIYVWLVKRDGVWVVQGRTSIWIA